MKNLRNPILLAGSSLLVLAVVLMSAGAHETRAADGVIVHHGGSHYRFQADFDEEEFEEHMEEVLESLERLDFDFDFDGLEGLGEHIAQSVESALAGIDVGDFDRHGRDHVSIDFDEGEFERHMEHLAARLERQFEHFGDRHSARFDRDFDLDERGLRRQIQRLERELEDLRADLEELEAEGEI